MGLRKRLRVEHGQVFAIFVVAMVVLIGMGAFAIDVGSWYRADRQAQTMADAAALAGAQALPGDPAGALALADQYANANGGSGALKTVTLSSEVQPNDTITVEVTDQAPGFLAKLFGKSVVDVHARAVARVGEIAAPTAVAPFVVWHEHEGLACSGPCPGTFTLDKTSDVPRVPGAFDLINLDGYESKKGKDSPQTLAGWILNGYDGYLNTGWYYQRTGSPFTSSHVQNAMEQREGTILLFPIVDELVGNGSNAQYHVIGWSAFELWTWDAKGNEATLTGQFVSTYWEGIQGPTGGPDTGVYDIQLIE